MSSTPRTKYGEYKEKLKEWSRLFEDEYGRRPTDDDRYDSATWVALNDKARHYRRLAGEEATPSPLKRSGSRGSRRHLDRSESTESVSRRHSQGHGGSSKSLDPLLTTRGHSTHGTVRTTRVLNDPPTAVG